MTEVDLQALDRRFKAGLLEAYDILNRELDYRPTYFLQMVQGSESGAEVAKRLLAKEGLSDGFVRLWEEGRLDLSLEAYVLEPEFAPLFTDDELAVARQRLVDCRYAPNN